MDGANATMGMMKQHGIQTNRREKLIVCFHCGKNHPVLECPGIPLKKREQIMASKNDEWAKKKDTQQAKRAAGKACSRQTVAGATG